MPALITQPLLCFPGSAEPTGSVLFPQARLGCEIPAWPCWGCELLLFVYFLLCVLLNRAFLRATQSQLLLELQCDGRCCPVLGIRSCPLEGCLHFKITLLSSLLRSVSLSRHAQVHFGLWTAQTTFALLSALVYPHPVNPLWCRCAFSPSWSLCCKSKQHCPSERSLKDWSVVSRAAWAAEFHFLFGQGLRSSLCKVLAILTHR